MLVLSRRVGERIVLPEIGASVVVLGVSPKRVRIGIEAPRAATVHRAEVWQRILDAVESTTTEDAVTPENVCQCSSP